MQIVTYSLLSYGIEAAGSPLAQIRYEDPGFSKAALVAGENYRIEQTATGTWVLQSEEPPPTRLLSTIRTQPAGTMTITPVGRGKQFRLKRSQGHKLRFSLFSSGDDEWLSLLPLVDPRQNLPLFTLQLNDEFEKECSTILILQSLHGTLCSLGMMLWGNVPALVST